MHCPFCNSKQHKKFAFPAFRFNNKKFNYVECCNCKLIYLENAPDVEDYALMYKEEYQIEIPSIEDKIDSNKWIPGHFTYQEHFDIIQSQQNDKQIKLLDYSCGNGEFVIAAIQNGIDAYGSEYNNRHVAAMKQKMEIHCFILTAIYLPKH